MSGPPLPRVANSAIALPFNRAAKPGEADTLREAGADIFELRIDLAGNPPPEQVEQMAASFAGHPLIATCRRQDEGGQGNDDVERLLLLAACASHASAIDIELASMSILPEATTLAQSNGLELIISRHHMTSTPEFSVLERDLDIAFASGAGIAKVVTTVSAPNHLATLHALLSSAIAAQRRVAIMGMGNTALAGKSRVELGKAGSLFVFAAGGINTAPGQPNLAWLVSELRGG